MSDFICPEGAVTIPLVGKRGSGSFALVDDIHAVEVSQWKWHLSPSGYAVRRETEGNKQVEFPLHRVILGKYVEIKPGFFADHVNGDTLDNRYENLRACTPQENSLNRKRRGNNTSGYKGVSISAKSYARPWVAAICLHGKRTYLGSFVTPLEAATAYDKAAKELHGEFARLNFPS